MTDYSTLIDAETWAFIEKTDSFYPPEAATFSVAENRAVYDRMCAAFFAGYPAGVSAKDFSIPAEGRDIPARSYRMQGADGPALILYFHGGGFILGGLHSHDDVCAELCAGTGCEVVSVDYRLAPEHLHPAAFDDAMAAFEWAAGQGKPVVLAGDSAGGNLAAAVSHATRGHEVKPVGQLLIYPGLGGDWTRGSYVEHAKAPMLTVKDIKVYRGVRTGGKDSTGDITIWPLADADFSNLPPTIVITAQCDPLSSDGEAYRDRINAAGGRALWLEERGLVHGYLRARHSVGRARASFVRMIEFLGVLARREWIA